MKHKLCILLHQVGPYHHARCNAIGTHFDLTVVEIRSQSTEYYWTNLDHGRCEYRCVKITGLEAIRDFVNTNLFDFFLTYGWNETEYIYVFSHARKKNIPVFMASDSIEVLQKWNLPKHAIKRAIARGIDGFLVAGSLSEAYIRWYKPGAVIEKPFDVVDNDHFARGSSKQTRQYLLCVARLIHKKNISALIEALSSVKDDMQKNGHVLKIVGSGELHEELLALCQARELGSLVEFLPWKSYHELPGIYHNASALVIPSLYDETWGLVVNEAMAAGLPILASDKCGCVPDLVHHGVNGFVFAPTAVDIARAIQSFLALPEQEKINMQQESLRVISRYTLDNHTMALSRLFKNTNPASKKRSIAFSLVVTVMIKVKMLWT